MLGHEPGTMTLWRKVNCDTNTSQFSCFNDGSSITHGERWTFGGKEWSSRRSLSLLASVPTILLTFLSDDCTNQVHKTRFLSTILSKDSLSLWKYSQNDIGESVGERDGGVVGCDGEIVLAWLDGGLAGVC